MTEAKRSEWVWLPDKSDLFPGKPPPPFLAPLVRWDANFYISLARRGYPERADGGPVYHVAFFPLYPLAVRTLAAAVHLDVFWSAFLVSNLSTLLAAFFLSLVRMGRRWDSVRASLLFLCAPGSHFLAYPYPEGLFALLLAAFIWAAASSRWLTAGVAGALATATRSAGVVTSLCLLVIALTRTGRARAAAMASAVFCLAGLGAFALFCLGKYGDPIAFAHIQTSFGRGISALGPVRAFLRFEVDPDYYLVAILALVAAVVMRRHAPSWLIAGAWFQVLLPLATGTLKAMIRFQAVNLPLFIGLAGTRGRRLFLLVATSGTVLMAFEAYLFGKGIGHY